MIKSVTKSLMTDLITLLFTLMLTTGYAALIVAIADKSPVLAAGCAAVTVVLWFIVGNIYFL